MANGGFGVQLDLRPVRKLRPHEDAIESNTREMAAQLRRDGIQRDPIIIDGDSGVVLDGMHRLGAFIELGIGYAACHPVDYGSPNITVGRWLRVYRAPQGGRPRELAEAAGLTRSRMASEALRSLDGREVQAAAFTGGSALLPPVSGNIEDGFAVLRNADSFARSHEWERAFVGESELEAHSNDESEVVVVVRSFGKEEVLKAGMVGHLFPCKTSMHMVDPRPVAVNVPLTELETGSTETLSRRLSENRFELLPPGSAYEGRRYKERLLLLSGR